MSVQNFVPQMWSATMLREREKTFVGIQNCNRDYEGEIKGKGDRVKISGLGAVNINDYTKNNFSTGLTLQTLDDISTMLIIDQSKYYNFAVDDVDAAQANQSMMTEGMRLAGLGLNDVADQFIFAKYGDAANSVTATITSANIISSIAAGMQKLYENNVPAGERFILEVSPQVATKMLLAKIIRDYDSSTLSNGKIGSFLNCDIHMSNNVSQATTLSRCLMRTKRAISYAEQMLKTQAYTLTTEGFGDAVKGLMVYGAKVIQPKEMVTLLLTTGSESTI